MITFTGCLNTFPKGSKTTVAEGSNGVIGTVTVTGPLTMWAQPIVIAYQSSDLSHFVTTTTTTSAPTSTPLTTSSPSGASLPTTSSAPTSDSGLSRGALAGIIVSAVVLCCAFLGSLVWLILRHRRRGSPHAGIAAVESDARFLGQVNVLVGLDSRAVAELDGRAAPTEVDGTEQSSELDGRGIERAED